MGDLSRNFDQREFDCRDGCGYGAVHPQLLTVLETLRRELGGRPLRIVSGLRCPPRNAAVSGAARSAHVWGGAADIPTGLLRPRLAMACGARGIGTKAGWVTHIDVRRTREPIQWEY